MDLDDAITNLLKLLLLSALLASPTLILYRRYKALLRHEAAMRGEIAYLARRIEAISGRRLDLPEANPELATYELGAPAPPLRLWGLVAWLSRKSNFSKQTTPD